MNPTWFIRNEGIIWSIDAQTKVEMVNVCKKTKAEVIENECKTNKNKNQSWKIVKSKNTKPEEIMNDC